MKISRQGLLFQALLLTVVLLAGMPSWALAQCGGGSGSMGSMHDQHMGSMHDQHMGSSGQMGSGQMGMPGNQAPVQTDPNAVTPGYAAPQNTGGYGQMMGQGGAGSDQHSGHRGR